MRLPDDVPGEETISMSDIASKAHFTLFQTTIGTCGIAWSGETIIATHLPEPSDAQTRTRLITRSGSAKAGDPPQAVQHAIEAIKALLAGERVDLSFIPCDFSAIDPFNARVYHITRTIQPGETLTYGEIALQLGDRLLAQSVGRALGRNPFPIIVPCHRVLGARGRLTGFSANGGLETKLRMLAIEGAHPGAAPTLFDNLPLAMKPGRMR
jgi:methylated-DNA-[protein]-cysteine S-methyltransferase